MKTADGKVVLRTADGKIVESSTPAAAADTKPTFRKANNNNAKHEKRTTNTSQKTSTTYKMRPTQMLISKNEGNTLSSWLRDIGILCIPLYTLYMMATHPIIKEIGQPKLTATELHEKLLHEYNQKVKFENEVNTYNFMNAIVDGENTQCFDFPNVELFTKWVRKGGIFQNRYKFIGGSEKKKKDGQQQQQEKHQPQGIIVNSRRRMGR